MAGSLGPVPWSVAELEAVLWALAPDERPSAWAAMSGQPETTVRIAIGVVARQRREGIGWTLRRAAAQAGVARAAVEDVEAGAYRPYAARWLWAAFAREMERRDAIAVRATLGVAA